MGSYQEWYLVGGGLTHFQNTGLPPENIFLYKDIMCLICAFSFLILYLSLSTVKIFKLHNDLQFFILFFYHIWINKDVLINNYQSTKYQKKNSLPKAMSIGERSIYRSMSYPWILVFRPFNLKHYLIKLLSTFLLKVS